MKSLTYHVISSFYLIEFQRVHKKYVILCGFDLYSPLNGLIRDYFSTLVSLVKKFTLIHVFSTTSQIRFVSRKIGKIAIAIDTILNQKQINSSSESDTLYCVYFAIDKPLCGVVVGSLGDWLGV